MENRGQVSIFVIVGIIIVFAVGVVVYLTLQKDIVVPTGDDIDAERFIGSCVKESVEKNLEIMLPQGGFVAPTDYKKYNNTNVAYLCKNINFYEPCIAQHPLYIGEVADGLEEAIEREVGECFVLLQDELERKNYDVVLSGAMNISVTFKPETTEVVVLRDVKVSKNGVERNLNSFVSIVKVPAYDLLFVAQEISRQEAQYCYFENLGYMLLNKDFDVRKYVMSDSTKIYTIKHNKYNNKLNVAIRGCAIPAGY